MTISQSTTRAERSLARDVLYAARYYLGNRWALLALGALAVIAGLSFGGWAWLVAAGLAPVILSTLPCLLMCAFGVCMACRSNKTQSTAVRDATDTTASPTTLGITEIGRPTAGSSIYLDKSHLSEVKQVHVVDERSDSHA